MAATLPCPMCAKPVPLPVLISARPSTFPFCCERCRLRDLGAWADGRYLVAGDELDLDALEPRSDRDRP